MKRVDIISGTILFLLGLGVSVKSLTYPIGTPRSPGGGLFPFLASVLLMCLSGLMLIHSFLKKDVGDPRRLSFFSEREGLKRIFTAFTALVAFRYLFPLVGFAPSTFIFIFFLSKFLGHYSWKISIFFGIITAFMAYYLFQIWLKVPMPQSILKI